MRTTTEVMADVPSRVEGRRSLPAGFRGAHPTKVRVYTRPVQPQVFEERFRSPLVAGGDPVRVVPPARVPDPSAPAHDGVVQADHRNTQSVGDGAHPVEQQLPRPQMVCGQDDRRRAVAVRALPELRQSEGRVLQLRRIRRR